ncbi:hypothetical protein G155_00167 [Mycobacterium sp. VKM Ac-1817D]|nr:hypothetical protein G155_00167 [Mycobacterium sp. VKM Ac-1817D]
MPPDEVSRKSMWSRWLGTLLPRPLDPASIQTFAAAAAPTPDMTIA